MESKHEPMLTTALLLKVPWIREAKPADIVKPCGGLIPRVHRMPSAPPLCTRHPRFVVETGTKEIHHFHLCTQHFGAFIREDAWALMRLEQWIEDVGNDLMYEEAMRR